MSLSNLGGGIRHHKPGCNCICCKPRPREKKAFPLPTGEGRRELVSKATTIAQPREVRDPSEPDPLSPAYNSVQPLQPNAINFDHPLPTTFKVRGFGKQYHGVARQHVADWITIRMHDPDITMTEAAKRLNIGRGTLYRSLRQGRAEGWLKLEDPIDRIEYEIIPKTVDNLNYFLDKKDKAVTIEAAKGTIFRQFQEAKGLLENNTTTVLALKIEAPPLSEGAPIKFMTGQIIGQPRQLQVIDGVCPVTSIETARAEVSVPSDSLSSLHPDLKRCFDFFPQFTISIVGSMAKDPNTAHDIDILFAEQEDFPAIVKSLGVKYNGWDTPTPGAASLYHVRRATFSIPGVSKPVHLLSWGGYDPGYCQILRDGTRIHDGNYFDKVGVKTPQ